MFSFLGACTFVLCRITALECADTSSKAYTKAKKWLLGSRVQVTPTRGQQSQHFTVFWLSGNLASANLMHIMYSSLQQFLNIFTKQLMLQCA